MKRNIIFSLFLALAMVVFGKTDAERLKLWYDKPAQQWVEALPVGNGRLGAMVFGYNITGNSNIIVLVFISVSYQYFCGA